MIPLKNKQESIDKLPALEEIDFTIGDPKWIMQTNADLYSNRPLAVIREISTNARDAMDEAGKKDKPIVVTLPDLMHPSFTVADGGVGMSIDDFRQTYTQFGVSPKRKLKNSNGMLGYGSKAPIAYTDMFTVTSVKDGQEISGAVIRKADGGISLKIVSITDTVKPNGTIVSVPVHNYEQFQTIAMDFYRFWKPGTVLVNGKEPEQAVGEKIKSGLYYSKTPGVSHVVMANVPYPIANPDALFSNAKMNKVSFVAYVPTGAVEFTPSREALKYSDHTKQTLQKIIEEFEVKMVAQAKKEIAAAPDDWAAWEKWVEWGNRLGAKLFEDLEFNGEKFVRSIDARGAYCYHNRPKQTYETRRMNTVSRKWDLSISELKEYLIVENYPAYDDILSHVKTKVVDYTTYKNITNVERYLFLTGPLNEKRWINPERVVDWETLKAEVKRLRPKAARGPRAGGAVREKGTFDYYDVNGFWREKPFPDGKLYYITTDQKSFSISRVLTLIAPDAKVVVLGKNRINKFQRDHPDIKNLIEHAESVLILDGPSLVSEETKKGLEIPETIVNWCRVLPVDELKDKRWAKFKKLHDGVNLSKYNHHEALARALGKWHSFVRHGIRSEFSHDIMNDYPLLRNLYSNDVSHIVLYMNAAYAAAKKGKK